MRTDRLLFTPIDNRRLANLCGALDENIKQIEKILAVQVARNNADFKISGPSSQVALAKMALKRFYAQSTQALDVNEIQLGLMTIVHASNNCVMEEETSPILSTRRTGLRGRTSSQIAYIKAIQQHDITFGIGPAGTGKTYLAVACAVEALEQDKVKRIVLVRPAVEAGERLGFLPGDLNQKVDPYLRPLYDALYELIGTNLVSSHFEHNIIEIAPLAYMRGRTLSHAFVILDEAQNTTPEQMKMFLTRIGFGSKVVITGDITQIDLLKHQKSGLVDAESILKNIPEIALHYFNKTDVVRHPLIQKIIDAYDSNVNG